jgi:Fe-S cluster assembly ATP-binding protein
VLRSVSLDVPAGALVVLMGANGSGKSTLGMALAGHPRYRVVAGSAAWAAPTCWACPRTSARAPACSCPSSRRPTCRASRTTCSSAPRSTPCARRAGRSRRTPSTFCPAPSRAPSARPARGHAGRPVNEGFSGGERKRNELLQLALLQPRLALLDEIDSGMDVDGVRAVVELVQRLRAQGTAFIVVSHYLQMIEQLQPDAVLRLDQGCIAETGDMELARASPAPALRAPPPPWRPEHGQRPRRHPGGPKPPGHARLDRPPQRILSPPAAARAGAVARPARGRRRLRRPAAGRRRLDAAPIGQTPASGVDARWLDALDPAQRAELFAGLPAPGDGDARPFAWATARCAARACACACRPPGKAPGEQDIVWLHLRHQPRARPRRRCWCSTWTRACAAC